MSFKDQIALDLSVFFNSAEFSDYHNLNGVECQAVVEAPTAKESFMGSQSHVTDTGIQGMSVFVYCKVDDIPEAPSQGNVFTLDGCTYLVKTCSVEDGVVCIELQGEAGGILL